MQISTLTRLNIQFAVDCLQNNGWDADRAVANFEQVKVRGWMLLPIDTLTLYHLQGTLGRDAFLQH